MIVAYARKNAHILNQRSPYFATTKSLLDNQFLYQRQRVAE